MGGVNCPPGQLNPDSPEVMGEYVRQLARYCSSLFGAASKFFAANALIEEAILNGENIDGVLTLLTECGDSFVEAQSHLGSVSALWSTITDEETDFAIQIENLGQIVETVRNSKMELEVLTDPSCLQESIWSNPDITEGLSEVIEKLSIILGWQTEFAKNSVLAHAS